MIRVKYKYKALGRDGKWRPWSGNFDTKKEATAWHEKHGRFHEQRGHKLRLFGSDEYIK